MIEMCNNKLPLISVIVPVYNCSDTLHRCVESLNNQSYPNIEIILVDDGSKDSSLSVCQKLASRIKSVRVFHQENKGQASARNYGVREAAGDFVAFVDADDWVDENIYEILYSNLKKESAQISCCGIERILNDTHYSYFNDAVESYRVMPLKVAVAELLDNKIITNSPCDKLFKASIVKSQPMKEGVIFEDFEIMPKWLSAANTIVYDGRPMYKYKMNEGSTMTNVTLKRLDEVKAGLSRMEFYSENYPELKKKVRKGYMRTCLNVLSCTRGADDPNKEREALRKRIITEIRFSDLMALDIKSQSKYVLSMMGLPLFDFFANKM